MRAKSAEVSFHLHATEDGPKVDKALMASLGVQTTSSEPLYGHNGNIIVDMRCALDGPQAESLLLKVLGGLPSTDRARLHAELGQHFDEKGTFFLRLDKQEMVLGHLALGESDAIRMRFKLEAKGMEAEAMVRECLT